LAAPRNVTGVRTGDTETHTGRLEGLEALRGLAILLVIVEHALPSTFGPGIVGVVMFFTLSGYLITGIISTETERRGALRFRRFYRNRVLRLYPALVVLLLGVVVEAFTLGRTQVSDLPRTLLVGLSYTGDLPFRHGSPAIGHLWTLATEEQFYLVWPLVLTAALRRGTVRRTLVASAALVMLVCGASLWLVAPRWERVYTLPTSWAVAIVVGAAAYFGRHQVARRLPARGSRGAKVATGAALTVLLAVSVVPHLKTLLVAYLLAGPAIAVATAVLVHYAAGWVTLPSPRLRPLLWLGTISYAAYLWNYAIAIWLHPAHNPVLLAVASPPLTVAAATASWFLVERPFRRYRARLEQRERERAAQSREPELVGATAPVR